MAIDAAWDPSVGPEPESPWEPEDLDEPTWRPLSDVEFEALFPWAPEPEPPFFEPEDPQDHAPWVGVPTADGPGVDRSCAQEPCADESRADEPGWAVPGVTDTGSAADREGGLSASSQAVLDEVDAATTAHRLAGARLYRAVTALRASDVLAETRYQRLSRLLEDHVRLDPKTVAILDRHAGALHPHVTPTGATTPAQLPATAAAVDDGVIDGHHVEIVAKTMDRLRKVDDLDETVLAVAEEQLAGLAATHSPRALASAAKTVADRLDPDGARPKDDDPAGNELHLTTRRNGSLHAKLVLREAAAAALFADAIRSATPAPASAVTADPETGLPPVSDDPDGGRRVGVDPRVEARDSKPNRQASGLLDLISASHRAGLDHSEDEQHPGSPTASMPLPDLDDHGDTTAWPTEPTPDADTGDKSSDADAATRRATEDGHAAGGSDATATRGEDDRGDGPGSEDDERHHDGPANPRPPDASDRNEDTDPDKGNDTDDGAERNAATVPPGEDADTDTDEPPLRSDGPPDDEPEDESPLPSDGSPDDEPEDEPPPHKPWSPPDFDAMSLPGRERVTLTVTLDYKTLRQQLTDAHQTLALLGDSTWIRPETARRLACDAEIIPVVLGSKGEVLDIGRKSRAVPAGIARAVIHRDRHCAFPGCRRRTRTTQLHHITHWAHGGDTALDNLVCLCRYHHDLVHHAGWDVAMIDHQPWFTPPAWLDPTRTPRHNRPWQITPDAGTRC
ncbi:DUF222 domain-containing protein [Actinomycetospora corticicola]|uniref:HNH nuclease domain-containing protein n=1 Tax=Actinomycetospora corticicola TaxID=663602 RepID=A0A7Y9DV48_9PSEU|nr:DUF222 domain-containing protein [Actinomycetospora corticicola]NYD36061.1 hypothetical protein [Actinomycetospora corticicola]